MTFRFITFTLAAAIGSSVAHAYTLTGSHWYSSTVPMQLQLGAASAALSDGSTSWGASAEDALAYWNNQINATRFTVVRDSTAAIAQGNRLNNVFFSNDVYGQAWGSGVLAITLTYTSGGSQSVECDVLFNKTLAWDSYRGAQHYTSSGAIYDFHRVAMHEFGHVLGLDHPDQAGQTVTAIMNSRISNLDTLAADDITGVQSIYGAAVAATVAAPAITTQPASRTVAVGGSVTFTVSASSNVALSYQWRKDGAPISGATAASYTIANVPTSAAGNYSVVVTNSAGSTTSANAALTVTTPTTPPAITTGPVSQSVSAGANVTFTVSATGTAPLSYAWRKNGVTIGGATQAAYSINSVQASDAGTYSVVVTNSIGSVTSGGAVLTVVTLPVVTAAPATQTVFVGNTITLSAAATGNPTPTYQWQKNGSNIAGATQSTYVISSAAPTDGGTYSVTVSNAAGSTTTVPVLVTVNYSQLVNLSTRGYIAPGGALTAGFVLRGSSDKTVIVRGIGPALNSFGVAGVLPDPNLVVQNQNTAQLLASNDSWSVIPQISTDFQTVGAFPLASGSADSASEIKLPPGLYSTRVTGDAAGTSGIALAEVYDAQATSFQTRLVNLSTLGYTGSGDNALVAGFSIQGNAPKRLLIRAVGPGLSTYGVTGLVGDPRVDVYPLGQSTPVLSNDNWGGTAALKAAFTAANAFPLADNSTDAAVVATLAPGVYSAVVTGMNGATGNVLVEIYDLDP